MHFSHKRRLATRLLWVIRARWSVLAAVLPGVALALANSTMLIVPSANIIDALDTDQYRIHWVNGGYQLGSALGMALTKFVGSRLGMRRAYLFGIVLFALAGGACGFLDDLWMMTPLRFGQGFGNGILICAAMLILWRAFPRQREFAMALYGMAVFVPMVAGAVIGGLLTSWQSWQLLFLVNLPLGALVFLTAWVLLPDTLTSPQRVASGDPALSQRERASTDTAGQRAATNTAPVKIDLVGLTLLAASIVTLNVVLDMGQYWGWFDSRQLTLWLAGFVISFGGFVVWGLSARQPLINLHVFGHWNTTLGLLIKVLFSINLTALLTLLAMYMVDLRGYQWWQAALVILPAVLAMPAAILSGIVLGDVRNNRLRIFAGLAVMAIATWELTALDMYTSKFWLAGVMGVWGLGAGLVIGPALLTIFADLPMDQTATLAGVFNICRSLPAYVATITLATFWTQGTDGQFDTLRQNVRYNRPVVAASYESAQQHFVSRGSPRDDSIKQSQALVHQWTHANSRAFALEKVLRDLSLVTGAALVLVALVRNPKAHREL